jgi:hypothetical protein
MLIPKSSAESLVIDRGRAPRRLLDVLSRGRLKRLHPPQRPRARLHNALGRSHRPLIYAATAFERGDLSIDLLSAGGPTIATS